MGEEEGVISVIPVEETIIDPLYEPLKLNRYELCEHLRRLKDISHLRYGFSPYLLFDVEGWKKVAGVIKGDDELSGEEAIFNDLLKKYFDLLDKFGDKGIKRNTLVKSLFECRNTIVTAHKAIKMLFDAIQIEDMVNMIKEKKIFEDGDSVYKVFMKLKRALPKHKRPFFAFFDNIKNIDIYDQILNCDNSVEKKIKSFNKDRDDRLKELEENTSKIKEKYNTAYYSTINSLDDSPKKKKLYKLIEYRFNKITHLYQLDYPVKVKCPSCGKELFMCEEGKIYSMKEALLRTFELRRARWLYMSGSLHTVHRASTHTRLSHEIGSMIVAVTALREIDVYLDRDMSISLGKYLLMKGELHEFLMANFLHDLGHAPLSHVLEPNPFIDLNHEEITRNLILEWKTEKEEGMNWYVTERYLLKMKAIKDFEFKFFKNRDDPIYDIDVEKKLDEDELRDHFLEYLKKNDEILESEIITVSEVLDNFGIDKKRVVEILTGKLFRNVNCPNCRERYKMLLQIEEDTKELKCKFCKKADIKEEDIERIDDIGKIYDTQFLNKFIHSEIDFDRIDHVKRDSVVCGLSLISFRLLELLGSMSVILPDSGAYKEIHNEYLFSWDEIPGNDNERLIEFLKDKFKIEWVKTENIGKIDGGKTIRVSNKEKSLSLKLNDEKTKVNLEIDDNRVNKFAVKTENGRLNIYHNDKPYILISENGLPYIVDLLTARRSVFNDILYSDENNWINGVVNQITALAVKYLPHLKTMLPFITDQILMQFYTNDLFLGTQIEKLNKLFHGKIDCSGYGKPMRYKLKDEADVKKKNLEEMHDVIRGINDSHARMDMMAVVFYTNIEAEEGGRGHTLKEKTWDDILIYGKKFDGEYYSFQELVKEKYPGITRERFPKRPSELDIKNLFYVWVSDFVVSDGNANENNGNKTKNEWIDYIKTEIGAIWTDKGERDEKIDEFMKRFVDLDEIHRGDENDSY